MPTVSFYEGTPGQPVKCLPESLDLSQWNQAIELVETPLNSSRWIGVLPVGAYLVFEKATQPANFSDGYLGVLKVSDVESLDAVQAAISGVQTSVNNVPKYGDSQRWTNPSEFLDVTITKNP